VSSKIGQQLIKLWSYRFVYCVAWLDFCRPISLPPPRRLCFC